MSYGLLRYIGHCMRPCKQGCDLGLCHASSFINVIDASLAGCAKSMQSFAKSPPGLCRRRLSWQISRCLSSQQRPETIMNVFDRKVKQIQRNRTALQDDCLVYDYLKEEVGWRMADRICDVKRKFEVAVDMGCGRGHIAKHVYQDMVGTLYMCDMAEKVLNQAAVSSEVPTYKVNADEEFWPFRSNSIDLVISSLSLHWVNDLPGTFKQIHNSLKEDGCFMGAMFGGDTLFELRVSLQQAEIEREGGFGPHVSPFTSVQDLGNLLNRAGFTMLTIDVDEIVINYPSMFHLMSDLQGMGENNAAYNRRAVLHRDTMKAAAAIYQEMYGSEDEDSVPATFHIISFIGWKPHPSQAKAAKRGSGELSMKDIDKLDQLTRQISELQDQTKGLNGNTWSEPLGKLAQDIEKLRRHTTRDGERHGDDDEKGNGEKS